MRKLPFGHKKEIRIQCQIRKPITREALMNLPRALRSQHDGFTKAFLPVVVVRPSDISDWDSLAEVIKENYGYGTFNITFYDWYNLNRKRHPCYACCKRWGIRWSNPRHKHVWWRCRKFAPNWRKRARVEIIPTYDGDWNYKVHEDEMRKYFGWFWRD